MPIGLSLMLPNFPIVGFSALNPRALSHSNALFPRLIEIVDTLVK
jgi:hypothetical protein